MAKLTRENERTKMDVLDYLEELKEQLETAKGVILSQNCIVNREYFLHILGLITNNLPSEIKYAKMIINKTDNIIAEAEMERKTILEEVNNRAAQMLREDVITVQAQEMADQIIAEANQTAEYIKSQALKYAEEKIESVEETLTRVLLDIRRDKEEF